MVTFEYSYNQGSFCAFYMLNFTWKLRLYHKMKSSNILTALFFMLAGCTNQSQNQAGTFVKKNTDQSLFKDTLKTAVELVKVNHADSAQRWLESIFQCTDPSSGKYCYYLDKEEALCTKQFWKFLQDANEIYGPSNLTDAEFPKAEAAYKTKWGKIYPLYTEETWLFGRGNDDALAINDVKIEKISDNKFSVLIDYGNDIRTKNELQLLREQGSYKIDYCKTTFLQ